MKRLMMLSTIFALVVTGYSQTPSSVGAARSDVLIVNLPPPVYPPIARAARVSGDVEVSFQLRADGTVVTAEAVSGPPMLRQAAIDGVKQAQFECKDCTGTLTSFSISYRFEMIDGPPCAPRDATYPRIAQSQNIITIQDQPDDLCDPAADRVRTRSAKCLYLWKCGWR
jgi:TonB family protein